MMKYSVKTTHKITIRIMSQISSFKLQDIRSQTKQLRRLELFNRKSYPNITFKQTNKNQILAIFIKILEALMLMQINFIRRVDKALS
jgi:hypothetical protein